MKPLLIATCAAFLFGSSFARAQSVETYNAQQPAEEQPAQMAQPSTAQPAEQPPPPPAEIPAPPQAAPAPQPMIQPQPQVQVEVVQPRAAANGQWIYTEQYGWVWMPYGNEYIYAPGTDYTPYAYLYYPSYGWRWLAAPWVF